MSKSETGHDNNVANFEDLISFCNGYGPVYNPGHVNFQIAQLSHFLSVAQQSTAQVKPAEAILKKARENRTNTFNAAKLTCSRAFTALKSYGASPQTLKAAAALLKKMNGRTKKLTKADAGIQSDKQSEGTKKHSTSRTGFDSVTEHVENFLELLNAEPKYTPNEHELSIKGFVEMITKMKAANTNVIAATTNASNARINRDVILYQKDTGLYFVALGVRNYIKALFGARSPQYKQVAALKFVNLGRNK